MSEQHTDPVIVGIGGPVGSGKTQLIERITRAMSSEISMAAITNDIYTIEDAKILARNSVLPTDRIIGIETGGCPHTAIREDTSMNDAAITELKERFPDLQLIFVESGGDNLSATFSPELVDFSIYVIRRRTGREIPRKARHGHDQIGFVHYQQNRPGAARARGSCRDDRGLQGVSAKTNRSP